MGEMRHEATPPALAGAPTPQLALEAVYQPIVHLSSGRIIGMEALARLVGSDGIGRAPDWQLAVQPLPGLSRFMLQVACAQLASWRECGFELSVSVNLSADELLDPEIPNFVREMIALHHLPAQSLKLEVIETQAIHNPMRMAQIFRQFQNLGVCIALDDFGTGHSSLAWLARFSVDEVKLDLDFAAGLAPVCERPRKVAAALIGLAHDLGILVTAEGVENAETLAAFTELGCDFGQGYWFSAPMSAAAASAYLGETLQRRIAPGQPV